MTRRIFIRRPDQFLLTPGGREGDPSPRDLSPRKNWVEEEAGMPVYMRMVRNALLRNGHDMQSATAIAVNAMKRWAAGGDDVHPQVQAAAAAALAEWDRKRAQAKARPNK